MNNTNERICGFRWVVCSQLVSCEDSDPTCEPSGHICVNHSRCSNSHPFCYPQSMCSERICSLKTNIPNIPANATWVQDGVTVAGGNGKGNATNQLWNPYGLFVDNDQVVLIADWGNHRVIQWKKNDTNGQVIAGGKGQGNGLNQWHSPTDVLIDKETDSLIICDSNNRRVVL
ncbi:unnamed protein product [Rotaria magnacalcarata]|uniref:Uncharacterized protein n=4 Tax=Rotaria magnacalcarata TaxID=392030 RepID=A0A815BJH6_9BILA|nr:unnamed protein product [Rotaria magnacalcarata]CAF1272411.1 unnamed protein product [Rotaria magnacalcarata]CAF1938985.1 unnamed protein product [Rotaria magnacalcarata]CAF3874881.1 unnamed protein product [Rotaria magnacalcarata]